MLDMYVQRTYYKRIAHEQHGLVYEQVNAYFR
jgi:hypothetical protein